MSTQRRSMKQGFTLIELMVVIVIIGILAAIAIPKLFGMSAKAKASEVGPAAGTWAKMYIAWALEKDPMKDGDKGTWEDISYIGPGEKVEDNKEASNTPSFSYTGGAKKWSATNPNKLNECIGGTWKGEFVAPDHEVPEMTITEGSGGGKECENLTPSFTKVGREPAAAPPPGGGS
jgi:prepilin-type N-terminal cleavage/methylation domain-containing protein